MNAAEHLYSVLGQPKGQLTVQLVNTPLHGQRLIVWVRNSSSQNSIPKVFDGIPVEVQQMPTAKAKQVLISAML